jgi:hypothetical protein
VCSKFVNLNMIRPGIKGSIYGESQEAVLGELLHDAGKREAEEEGEEA